MKINDRGFTIIEIMIVLAVTMILFFLATVFINGKQQYNAFIVSVNNIQTKLTSTYNNVLNGSFSSKNFDCREIGNHPPYISPGSEKQGTRVGCIFLGDVISFNQSNLTIYPIIGNQNDSLGNSTYSFTDPGSYPEIKYLYSGYSSYAYTNGINITCMQYSTAVTSNCGRGTHIGSIIIGYNSLGNTQSVNIIPFVGTSLNQGANTIQNLFNHHLVSSSQGNITPPTNFSGGIQICFSAGGVNDSALFQIGGSNISSDVRHKIIFNNSNC